MVNEIIKLNSNVNSFDNDGCTALMFGKKFKKFSF
jgi:hypothetical protein